MSEEKPGKNKRRNRGPRHSGFWTRRLSWSLVVAAIVYGVLHAGWFPWPKAPTLSLVKLGPTEITSVNALIQHGRMSCHPGCRTDSLPCRLFETNCGKETVKEFLEARLSYWEDEDRKKQWKMLLRMQDTDVQSYLGTARFKVHSYFWLTGWASVLEVIFWTTFGVLCSMLFALYDARRRFGQVALSLEAIERGVDAHDIPNQLGKLAFAPFVSVVLILSYRFVADDDGQEMIETSSGIVIVSFLLGFYSSRALRMLDRIKDVLLPYASAEVGPGPQRPSPPVSPSTTPVGPRPVRVRVALDPRLEMTHAAVYDTLKAELARTLVIFVPAMESAAISAVPSPEGDGASFSSNLPAGRYSVVASLSVQGLDLSGKVDLDTERVTSVEVLLGLPTGQMPR